MILRSLVATAFMLPFAGGTLRAEMVPLKSVAHIHGIAVDPADPQRLYLATHHGLYRTAPTAWQSARRTIATT
jgi:hypothetical protein